PEYIRDRRLRASIYNDELKGIELYTLPKVTETHTFNQYTIRVLNNRRDECKAFLTEQGISSAIYYPYPLNRILSGCIAQDCPVAEQACKEVLSIPIAPEITLSEIEYIITKLKDFAAR
ncbi:DegT/DnrJ/EryC1/StrS family aminotransferase, partial [Mangrovimonas sp. AS39]|uniref:DegT/DnrJ/EryC1/StrS family aminotransferase n=1 Tax=Mangrovimonas futianensis TaxID=2895523 RepID=UPI001E395790